MSEVTRSGGPDGFAAIAWEILERRAAHPRLLSGPQALFQGRKIGGRVVRSLESRFHEGRAPIGLRLAAAEAAPAGGSEQDHAFGDLRVALERRRHGPATHGQARDRHRQCGNPPHHRHHSQQVACTHAARE